MWSGVRGELCVCILLDMDTDVFACFLERGFAGSRMEERGNEMERNVDRKSSPRVRRNSDTSVGASGQEHKRSSSLPTFSLFIPRSRIAFYFVVDSTRPVLYVASSFSFFNGRARQHTCTSIGNLTQHTHSHSHAYTLSHETASTTSFIHIGIGSFSNLFVFGMDSRIRIDKYL